MKTMEFIEKLDDQVNYVHPKIHIPIFGFFLIICF